ncbi:MAG: 8-amino-7-oxononanoate synthase 2 [Chlamydiae bacterium]|nr:8-amino-7-oxononanoate synthase 2 [Chlamydiota bacterium]
MTTNSLLFSASPPAANLLSSPLLEEEKRVLRVMENRIDFASNDYLGFASSLELRDAIAKKVSQLEKVGSTGSRLLTGNSVVYEDLEREIAAFHGAEAGLLFSSGYAANLGLLSAVAHRDDTIFYDQRVHASIRDGITLSRARNYPFHHNCCSDLERLLQKGGRGKRFVVVESVYSTTGALAPLQEIAALGEAYGVILLVDEAHATGVFGAGRVTQEEIEPFARVHTFGKALGVSGGIILGSSSLRDYLISHCRPFIYTTALSSLQLIAIEAAYDLLERTSHTLLEACRDFGLESPIDFISFGNPERAKKVAASIQQEGFDVRPLLYPTVLRGEEGLRICFHTYNTKEEGERLYASLDRYRD